MRFIYSSELCRPFVYSGCAERAVRAAAGAEITHFLACFELRIQPRGSMAPQRLCSYALFLLVVFVQDVSA